MLRNLLDTLKRSFPVFFRVVFSLRDWMLNIPAYLKLSSFQKSDAGIAVAYLSPHFPQPPSQRTQFAHGGAVKLTYLSENFPHHFPSANLLYTVSSISHPLQFEVLKIAKKRNLRIVVNQNGVAFPAWNGNNYEASNRSLKQMINFAEFIVYQSQFCKDGAERYISPPDVPSEIIYNPVDIHLFSPKVYLKRTESLTLLLGGNQYEKYRLELALQTLKALHHYMPSVKLIVTGKFWLPTHEAEIWIKQTLYDMDLTSHVTFIGAYAQIDAPALYSQADLLLHTQYADASPGLVLEAMALGMPVVHLDNGGVPELVGDAGMGVHVEHDWDKINLPDPQAMADAVMQVYARREEYSQKARQRAVDLFSLEKFVSKHKEIFEKVMNS